jgi:hypothetical protein
LNVAVQIPKPGPIGKLPATTFAICASVIMIGTLISVCFLAAVSANAVVAKAVAASSAVDRTDILFILVPFKLVRIYSLIVRAKVTYWSMDNDSIQVCGMRVMFVMLVPMRAFLREIVHVFFL